MPDSASPTPAPGALDLVAPRGYCAGVDRAIETVERALDELGPPVYVRGEIVHNRHVVDTLAERGAVFVPTELEVPEGATIILSAHGVAPEVYENCRSRNLRVIDATCPLVSKVHAEVRRFASRGATVLLVGHADHDEVIGTRGEAADRVIVVEDADQARTVEVPDPQRVALTTQTTLSLDDTAEIVRILRERFPDLELPPKSDICYATQNRQLAVKQMAADADLMIVVGSRNSSNSVRLVEVALEHGARAGHLVDYAAEIDPAWLDGVVTVGVTSGASVPEILVRDVLAFLAERGYADVQQVVAAEESLLFALPNELRRDLKASSGGDPGSFRRDSSAETPDPLH